MQLIGSVAGHHQHPARPQRAGQEGHHIAGGAVGPVQVLQHHHHRGPLSAAQQHGPHGVEHLQLIQADAGLWIRRCRSHQPWQQPAKAGRRRGDLGQQLRVGRILSKTTQGINDGQIGQADVAKLDTAADKHPHPTPTGPVGELRQQAGLAHPSIASQQHQLRPALLGPVQDRRKPTKLIGPADQRLGS